MKLCMLGETRCKIGPPTGGVANQSTLGARARNERLWPGARPLGPHGPLMVHVRPPLERFRRRAHPVGRAWRGRGRPVVEPHLLVSVIGGGPARRRDCVWRQGARALIGQLGWSRATQSIGWLSISFVSSGLATHLGLGAGAPTSDLKNCPRARRGRARARTRQTTSPTECGAAKPWGPKLP